MYILTPGSELIIKHQDFRLNYLVTCFYGILGATKMMNPNLQCQGALRPAPMVSRTT